MSNKRQIKYSEKMERMGFISVRTWIPMSKKEEIKAIAEGWRDEHVTTVKEELKHKET